MTDPAIPGTHVTRVLMVTAFVFVTVGLSVMLWAAGNLWGDYGAALVMGLSLVFVGTSLAIGVTVGVARG